MALPQTTQYHLALTAEQLIRRSGGPGTITAQTIGQRLYDMARPDSRGTRREYNDIARAALRMAQAAFTAEQNLSTRQRTLPVFGGLGAGDDKYYYRVIVVARDGAGNELWSTAVNVTSDREMEGYEVKLRAVQSVSPTPQHYTQQTKGHVIASYDTYIMLAGMRA